MKILGKNIKLQGTLYAPVTHQNIIVVKWGLEAFLGLEGFTSVSFAGPLQLMLASHLLKVGWYRISGLFFNIYIRFHFPAIWLAG